MSMEVTGVFREPRQADVAAVRHQRQSTDQHVREERKAQERSAKDLARETDLAVRELDVVARILNYRLKFSVNRDLEQVVVKVVDAETDKVIKELPPEEIQHLRFKIKEAIGLFIDEEI